MYYYAIYIEDAERLHLPEESVGKLDLFYKVWRNEFPWVK